MRVVNAVDSPWLRTTLDTGNSLSDQYSEYEALANDAVLVQAKTYFGGGIWYELDIDYQRVAKILKAADYKGFISLEFEGKDDWKVGVPKSLAMLREVFAQSLQNSAETNVISAIANHIRSFEPPGNPKPLLARTLPSPKMTNRTPIRKKSAASNRSAHFLLKLMFIALPGMFAYR